MDAELIIKLIIALGAVLAVLIFFLFVEPKEDTRIQTKPSKKSSANSDLKTQTDTLSYEKPTLDSLVNIVKNKKSDSQKLAEALSLIIEHYGVIAKKMGIRPHKDFNVYMDVLFSICRHPHTTKDIILDFDRELERLNPEYKKEINEAITKGLYSRGA